MATTIALDALPARVGSEVAVSDWFEVGQERIATFAEATDDRQWIHLDPERCKRESPFGQPVAHGFLTLSLLPAMLTSALAIEGMRMGVNYGLNKVRFPSPLPAGSRVRGRWTLRGADAVAGGWQFTWDVTIEAEGAAKPVCVAEFLIRCYA
ncbi:MULTISPECIES: MaoC family dehydratase [Massilia]|uniref:Dehydratase n=1 Tax=Massilia aurea TaxID=373040 RepID=A0A422QCU6_9BURK|nr:MULTISPECIES: MaoC family dehydratase [Massilia]MDY0964104.1 MaoC family dehydratase [Massilia sp. CFBP9026]RNF27821.1 dehydratase [Massilia aurea]